MFSLNWACPQRRRPLLFLVVGLIYVTIPVASYIQYAAGGRSFLGLAASTPRGGLGKGEFPDKCNPAKNSTSRRRLTNQVAQFGSKNPKSTTRKKLGAIVFNKWLASFLREENGSPYEAERLLLEKIKEGIPDEDFDTLSFNLILNALAQKRTKDSARRADELLQILLQIPHLRADGYSYLAVLNAWAKSGGKREAALRSEELLEQMEHSITVNCDFCYNAVMDCWSVSGCDDSGLRAERWLRRLEEQGPYPTRISYNACIKAWARTRNGAPESHRLLMRMKQIGGDLSPDKISYSTCIDAWCRSASNLTDAAVKAEVLLHHLEQSSQENEDLRPDIVAYTSVLYAFAKAGVDTQRALGLIDRLKKYGNEQPNTTFLNTMIHLFAKQRKIGQAEVLFVSMKKGLMADKITYTSLISANANVGNATRALELWEELEALYEETKELRYLPTTKTVSSVLYAISRCRDFPGSIDIAERLLNRLFELYRDTQDNELVPNTIAYSQVFLILSTSSDPTAPARALKLMEHMKEEERSGNRHVNPDAATYAYLINTLTKARTSDSAHRATEILRNVEQGYKSGDDNLKPTQLLYSAVLQAYAKSASPDGANKAEELLQRTKNLYRSGKMYAKPTTLYYNAVMDAHARAGQGREAAIRAEELLLELESRCRAGDLELAPTTRSYNAAILAWKNSNASDAPHRVEALLKRMNDRYGAGDTNCRPDRVTINSIISVWAKSKHDDAPQRAEKFLNFMVKLYCEVGDDRLKPDSYSFNSVIDAYSRSSFPGAARRAEALYKTMKRLHEEGDRGLKPDIITLTSLRHAWVRSEDKDAHVKLKEVGRLISKERGRGKAKKAVPPKLLS